MSVNKRGRVWIVEDSHLEAELARQSLGTDVEVELFDDGAVLLERLATGDVPDVLMLDWTLPSMSGVEVCRAIRETRDELALPILLVTSRRSAEDVAEAFAAGANDFVPKPYMPIELSARIQALLRMQRLLRRTTQAERDAEIARDQRKVAELDHQALIDALAAQPMLRVCVVQGPNLVYRMANAAYIEHVAHGEDILGRPALEVLPELKDQGFEALLASVKATGEAFVRSELAIPVHRAGGGVEEGFFGIVCQPMQGRDGTFDSVLVVAHETTELVRAREDLRKRADFERQLIGIVSHDLRNPLGAIAMGTEVLLRQESLDERSLKVLLRIRASASRGARMVGDLLDFTQARVGGGIPVHPAPANLHTVVRQVVDEVTVTSPDREILVTYAGEGRGAWDIERLAQVMQNLVGNAIKYSPPASPVSIRCESDDDQITVSIHNIGTPIAPDALDRIFSPMQRATDQLENSARSVGLGLFIVKHLVEAHGGTLSVASSARAGTTFAFQLPRQHAIAPTSSQSLG